jgi:hypothetical protein
MPLRHVVRLLAGLGLVMLGACLGACLGTPGTPCGAALCADGTTCEPVLQQCVAPDQRTACARLDDGMPCRYRGRQDGLCRSQICLRAGCGDGFIRGTEQCDGDDLGAATDCASVGWYGDGQVRCSDDCAYDLSACRGSCGDGEVQAPDEQCDGADLSGASCASLGFHGGTLSCLPNCRRNLADCGGRCGDGTRTAGEACDGNDFGGQGCADLGFHTGRLACSADCQRVDTSACTGTCGDGVRNGPEVCDGGDTARASCQALGWNGGTLGCRADCSDYDTSGCSGYCGDGVANGNELCDGADQRGASCTSFGARGGGLGCDAACRPTFERCHWGQWRPADVPFQAWQLGGSAPDDVWAVESPGLAHYDGMRWRDVVIPGAVSNQFFAAASSAPDDAWVAGDALFHWDGRAWQRIEEVSGVTSLWSARRHQVWGAGDQSIVHFDGEHWTRAELALTTDPERGLDVVTSLWGSRDGDMWAVTNFGRTLHLQGGQWVTARDDGMAIWGTSSHDLWIVTHQGIEHYDGIRWTIEVAIDAISGPAIWGSAHDDVWVSGSFGVLLHYDGRAWRETSASGHLLHGGLATAPGDVWGATESLHHYDGAGWIETPLVGEINGIWSQAPDDVWMVGTHGVIQHFDGVQWTTTSAGDRKLLGVWASADDDVWVVGAAGTLLHYDGAAWTEVASGTTNMLLEVYGTSASDVWGVGLRGTILHFDGREWRPAGPAFPPPTDPDPASDYTFDLRRVWASGPDNVWIMANMRLVHFDGSAWSVLDLETWFADLWGTGPDDLWIAEENGIMHDDGTGLREVFRTAHSAYSVWGSGPHDVWLFGEFGAVHHFDGAGWNPVDLGTSRDVTKVRGSGAGDAWAINFHGGALMHLGHPMPTLHGGMCRAPIPLHCESSASGATYGAAATFSHYGGAARDDVGGEDVYRLDSPVNGQVRIDLEVRHADLDLIAIGSGDAGCTPDEALAASQHDGLVDEAVVLDVSAGETRYFVVDGHDGPGAYAISATCTRR